MKIIPLAHKAIGKLALIGLLFSPFALTPSYAAELVGKPVPVGAQAVAASAVQVSSEAPIAATNPVAASGAAGFALPIAIAPLGPPPVRRRRPFG